MAYKTGRYISNWELAGTFGSKGDANEHKSRLKSKGEAVMVRRVKSRDPNFRGGGWRWNVYIGRY